ncbi:LacI family DNA-binding transcriptional regulator [Paraburkholderia bannensis]|uniref:LacI family DNA-binding transcriptional regulator n=1 Tax=Paraburkholderia bannensis TaxID=765414 RepID=UPI002AB7EC8A|nr:LacI family DNA-binding transcriptional regulator [Paraburkholderia bannensis]
MTSPISDDRKRRVRFEDIATLAGVSVSTVNRALNEIGSVSERAKKKVLDAARQLQINRILPDERTPILHFDVLLPRHHSPLLKGMEQAFDFLNRSLGTSVHIHRKLFSWDDERSFATATRSPRYPRSGLIVFAPDRPLVRSALDAVIASGEPVAMLICDFQGLPEHFYCGIDHVVAGRTAGYWMSRLGPSKGRVLVALGMTHNSCHDLRAEGFEAALKQFSPHLKAERLPAHTQDKPEVARRMVNDALKQGPIVGVYDTGYATQGIGSALAKANVDQRVVWITHEMLDEHKQLLEDGRIDLIIDQDPSAQVLTAVRRLLRVNGRETQVSPIPPIELRLYSAPNVPQENYLERYLKFPTEIMESLPRQRRIGR